MDTAIKAEWYDLDDGEREEFLGWFHAEYLPSLEAVPGHIWVGHYERAPETGTSRVAGAPDRVDVDDPDIPTGSQFLLVVAAASPDVFFNPNAAEQDPDRSV